MKLMKKIMFTLCLLFAGYGSVSAQNISDESISFSVDAGPGITFGSSNLSAAGSAYRGEHKSGFSVDVAGNVYIKRIILGMKYNHFTASKNYGPTGNDFDDNINVRYYAPQIGYRTYLSSKTAIDLSVGAGYLRYTSELLNAGTEYGYSGHAWGKNADLAIIRKLSKHFDLGFGTSIMSAHVNTLDKKQDLKSTHTLMLDKWDGIKIKRADFYVSLRASL